jgi:tRNA nucleotidyltransferase (CCA-adding enzyme)
MEPNFKKLLENIMLTSSQADDARTKYTGVCETLHNSYYPNITYNGLTKLLIGSYGKSTNIRPPRDIDVIFKMPDIEFARIDGLSGNKQSQLLQEIRNTLKDTYTTTEEIRAFGKVVVVNFLEGTHTVEVLPAWQMSDGKFKIPNTENGGSWEIFDPQAEIKNISDSNNMTGKTITLIRFVKKWDLGKYLVYL